MLSKPSQVVTIKEGFGKLKGWMGTSLGAVGHMVSVAITWFYNYSMKAAINNMYQMAVSTKNSFTKIGSWPFGPHAIVF